VSSVPLTVTSPAVVRADAAERVPLTVRAANPFDESKILTVVPAPVMVTVLDPAANVDPAPEVSQIPVTVHAPVVSVSVPEAPPVIATFDTLTADAFAVSTPPLPRVSTPPVRARLLVARVVAPAPPWTDKVPDQMRRFVAMVNVTVDAPLLNVMSVNSEAAPGRTAKVIVWEADELNVMGDAKFQDADVDAFVQDPEAVHEPAPPDVM